MSDPFALVPDLDAAFGDLAPRVEVVVRRQQQLWSADRDAWVVLPVARRGATKWLVVANDAEGERQSRELLAAFVGPAVGRVPPERVQLDPSRAEDRPFCDLGLRHLVPLVADQVQPLVEALELLVAVRCSAPSLRRDVEDPVGYLLRDFYLSLDHHDEQASARLLERLEATGLVGSENLRFLVVERLARLGRWAELAELPWFRELARARRPLRISEHLLEALWRAEFADPALVLAPDAARAHFEQRGLGSDFRALLDAVDVPTTRAGRSLVYLWSGVKGDRERCERIMAGADANEVVLLERLGAAPVAPVAPPEAVPTPAVAGELLDAGAYGDVVGLVEAHPGEPGLLAVAVRAAYESANPELARRVGAVLGVVGVGGLPQHAGFQRLLVEVHRLGQNRCAGWAEWLDRLARTVPWSDAAEVARNASAGWDPNELGDATLAASAADDLVRAAEGVNASQLRATLDLMCGLASRTAGRASAEAFGNAVLLVLAEQDNASFQVREAFTELVERLLAAGPDAARYSEIVSVAVSLWTRVRSPEALTWALDLADILAVAPCPDVGARRSFVYEIGTGIIDQAHRIRRDQRQLLESLAGECGTSIALPPVPAEELASADPWSALSGKKVGLYSLLPGAGPRLRSQLSRLNPSVEVEYNADEVATEALRGMARRVDMLVVDTQHAVHAATGAIDAIVPRDRQVLPSGRGVSSFLAALRERVVA